MYRNSGRKVMVVVSVETPRRILVIRERVMSHTVEPGGDARLSTGNSVS